jgi:hypothetical protein
MANLETESSFRTFYRMSRQSFNKLLGILHDSLRVDEKMLMLSTGKGPIQPAVVLHCTIRWLAGGSHHDIRMNGSISKPSFYRIVHVGMKAIVHSPQLRILFASWRCCLRPPSERRRRRRKATTGADACAT